MQGSIRKALVSGTLILFAAGHFIHAQQHQSKTLVAPNGEKLIVDVNTGFTVVDKTGTATNIFTAVELKEACDENDKQIAPSPESTGFALPCEIWAELQPHTQIERLPFLKLRGPSSCGHSSPQQILPVIADCKLHLTRPGLRTIQLSFQMILEPMLRA